MKSCISLPCFGRNLHKYILGIAFHRNLDWLLCIMDPWRIQWYRCPYDTCSRVVFRLPFISLYCLFNFLSPSLLKQFYLLYNTAKHTAILSMSVCAEMYYFILLFNSHVCLKWVLYACMSMNDMLMLLQKCCIVGTIALIYCLFVLTCVCSIVVFVVLQRMAVRLVQMDLTLLSLSINSFWVRVLSLSEWRASVTSLKTSWSVWMTKCKQPQDQQLFAGTNLSITVRIWDL